jgi:hypothetical protein
MDTIKRTFDKHYQSARIEQVKDLLETSRKPLYESQLLKRAFDGIKIIDCSPLLLYQHHFVLYNILYKLQEQYNQTGRYLHIHFMRTGIFTYPEAGKCRHFDDNLLTFCSDSVNGNDNLCARHLDQSGADSLDTVSIRWFYLDPTNYDRLDEESAEAFLSGSFKMLTEYRTIQESYDVLDMPRGSDLTSVKKRFKYLAKIHHPDKGAENHEEFARINSAYQILLRTLALNSGF